MNREELIKSIYFKPEFEQTHGGCPPRYLGGKIHGLENIDQYATEYAISQLLGIKYKSAHSPDAVINIDMVNEKIDAAIKSLKEG